MDTAYQGFIIVDKPVGLTSFQAVSRVRYLTKIKKVGHAGTLDPIASGVLCIAIGRAYTRQIDHFQSLEKTYEMSVVFGISTDTHDAWGAITHRNPVALSSDTLITTAKQEVGELLQTPPSFSAKKINGKAAYRYARQGIPVELAPCPITIYDLEILSFVEGPFPQMAIRMRCSKGTYVRSWVHTIGQKLGIGAYVKTLVRTAIGPYWLDKAIALPNLTPENLLDNRFLSIKTNAHL